MSAIASLLAFVVYLFLAAPGNEWLDAGELTAAAYTLGVSHPPAQPVHALLGKAATLLPFGEIAFRLSLLSALASALAVGGVIELVRRLLPDGRATLVAAGGAALLVGLAPVVVEQATRPEVYAPVLALAAWGAAFALGFVRGGAARDALTAAFLFALAAGLQPLVAAAVALPMALALALAAGRRLAHLALPVLALGVLALAVYAYLPLRASAATRPLLLWDNPHDLAMFLRAVRGEAYAGNFALDGIGSRLVGHAWLLGEGSGLPLLLLGGAGLGFALLTRLRGAGALVGAAALPVAATATQKVFYPDNPDVHGYLAPALVFLAAGLAALIVGITRALHAQLHGLPPGRLAGLIGIPALALALAGPTLYVRDGGARRADDASRWVDETLGRVAPGPAILVTTSDHALFTAMYERLVAGDRPDVAISNTGLMTSSWHLEWLKRQQPALFVPFVDDGRSDGLAARFLAGNAGRPISLELPAGTCHARGWIYDLGAGDSTPARPPLVFEGEIGRRIGRYAGLVRARFEARAGRWLPAVRAAGVEAMFTSTEALATASAATLLPELPQPTPIFVFADWQAELVARDAAFAAGMGAGPPVGAERPFELRLLHAWHTFLIDPAAGEPLIAPLGVTARLATAQLLASRGRAADAEAQLAAARAVKADDERVLLFYASLAGNRGDLTLAEQLLADASEAHPTSPAVWKNLGVLRARQQRVDEARAAFTRALELDPRQPDVRAMLDRLSPSGP